MSTLVVGTVALDSVETPFGQVREALGGTAVFFSLATSLFTDVQLVSIVGEDFPDEGVDLLRSRNIDLAGLQRHPGRTFRWAGRYDFDMNIAHTLDTQLNVLLDFDPVLPDHFRDARFVFLGNIDPDLQLQVLDQVRNPMLTALDTMNYWISSKKDSLGQVISRVDCVIINEGEVREFTGKYNVLEAAREIMALGPRIVVVKRGEYGALLVLPERVFLIPAYPVFDVRDTTGAGDSFAGGFMGYLDQRGSVEEKDLRAAVVVGTVVASHTVEDFSIEGLLRATPESIRERHSLMVDVTRIDHPTTVESTELVIEGV